MRATEKVVVDTTPEGKRIYIKRPCTNFAAIAAYQEAFAAEAKQGLALDHPNILKYIGFLRDEKGAYIALEYSPTLPINRALINATLPINTPAVSKKMMNQLMDAVEYLHAQGIYHLNIRPENILVTKANPGVRLINPANTYADCTPSFFLLKEQYTAPELFNEDAIPGAACDIYSLGKFMEYLYSYSHISYGIQRIIKKATHPNPTKRYTDIAQMRQAFNRHRYTDWSMYPLKGTMVVAALAIAYWGLRDEPVSTETLHFIEEIKREKALMEAAADEQSPTYGVTIPSDTLRVNRNDSTTFNQEEHRRLAEEIFRKEFRKRAEPIINSIYTPQKMNMTSDIFEKQSLDLFGQLDKVQKELAEQFHLDPIFTTRVSSDIISELTTQSMNNLRKRESKD